MRQARILSIIGTRPEAVKMAPVHDALLQRPWARPAICTTGQHGPLVTRMLDTFALRTDHRLPPIRNHNDPHRLLRTLLERLPPLLESQRPDLILAEGDTTTVLAAALAAYYARIPFGHVEAGLRTGNLLAPFPEEMNRILAARVAELHFAPTPAARLNLLAEGIPDDRIFVTGNTVVDAVRSIAARTSKHPPDVPGLPRTVLARIRSRKSPLLLVTAHRRENLGPGLDRICLALRTLAARNPAAAIVFPVHPNPQVRSAAASLAGTPGISLLRPLPYPPFVHLLANASLVLTDSGGVQEEASALAVPLLVLRNVTERPEVLGPAGILAGTDPDRIVSLAESLLLRPRTPHPAPPTSPLGDGLAGTRLVAIIERWWMRRQRSDT